MKTVWLAGLVVVGLVGLACSGLGIGPGANVASVTLQPGQTSTLSYTAAQDGPVGVWLDYDLSYTAGSARIGPVTGSMRPRGYVEGPRASTRAAPHRSAARRPAA